MPSTACTPFNLHPASQSEVLIQSVADNPFTYSCAAYTIQTRTIILSTLPLQTIILSTAKNGLSTPLQPATCKHENAY